MYEPEHTKPMENELSESGVKPLHSPDEVDDALKNSGTSMIVVNSVCGCAAGGARPGVKLALKNSKRPENLYTVFAGVDTEATQRARDHIQREPSSPSVGIFKDGKLVFFMPRHEIEGRSPEEISGDLTMAFEQYC
jgi:putative YphP/YqiW family bacilliredoxin